MELKVKKLHPDATLPRYATDGAACFDIFPLRHQSTEGESTLIIDTGLAFEVPPGKVMLVFSRSGHGFKHNIRLANCVGVIDSDYRGELKVKLTADLVLGDPENFPDQAGLGMYAAYTNDGDIDSAPVVRGCATQFEVVPDKAVAQAMIIDAPQLIIREVNELNDTARGTNGFGSTS